jgi:hypothetical protein
MIAGAPFARSLIVDRARSRLASVAVSVCLIASAPFSGAGGQSYPRCERAPNLEPTVLTIEGGGSLGVYEAGMTYVLVETFKRKRAEPSMPLLAGFPNFCLKAATGASAGNINAFLAAVSWCDATRDTIPEDSPFWHTWVMTGLTQLLPTHGETTHKKEGGLFTRRHFREYVSTALHRRWSKAKTIPGCVVEFGSTVTRLAPDTVPGAGTIKARNQRMAFALRVRGIDMIPRTDSVGPEPHLTAFVPDTTNNAYGRLTMLGPANKHVDSLGSGDADTLNRVTWKDALRLIETSSGYPVAFEPLKLEFCRDLLGKRNRSISDWTCGKRDSVVVLDGGVFDNGPIALGYLLYFETDPGSGPRPPTAIYLSPDRRRVWPEVGQDVRLAGRATKSKSDPHGLESIAQLAREAASTARQYELAFAGRILPTEIALRHGEGRISGLLGELKRQERMHGLERDSLRRAIAQLCLAYRLAQRDPLAPPPSSCGSLVSPDTTNPSRPSGSSSFNPLPYSLSPGSSLRIVASMATIDSTFRSTERWHPLAGDWLAGFGAFLGRPLREYDFYVGMYDAFVLLAENLHCAVRPVQSGRDSTKKEVSYSPEASNTARAARAAELHKCLVRTLPVYLDKPPIPLGPIAPHILRDLFEDEFKIHPRSADLPSDSGHRASLVVIRAIRQAMHDTYMPNGEAQPSDTARAKPASGHCTKLGMFETIYCKPGGVVAFLDQLVRHEQAVAIMKQWSKADGCRESRWQRPDLCKAEPRFVQMIDDAEGRLSKFVGQLLWRLEGVTPPKSGSRMGASALLFIHSSFVDRHRRGFSVGPTSVPRSVGWRRRHLLNLLPSSVMLTPNIAGWPELTWEGRYHLGETRYALAVPIHARVQSEIGKRGPGSRDVSMIVPGFRLEDKEFVKGTRLGVEIDAWFTDHGVLREYLGLTYGLYTSILSKIDVSLTTVPAELTYFREKARIRLFGEPLILTAGLGDVSGIVYWSGRFVSSRWKGARGGG